MLCTDIKIINTRIGGLHTGFWLGNLRAGYHFEDPDMCGRITITRIFRKWNVGARTGSISFTIGTGGLLLKTGYTKCWEFLG
jgi:hypothetical protein